MRALLLSNEFRDKLKSLGYKDKARIWEEPGELLTAKPKCQNALWAGRRLAKRFRQHKALFCAAKAPLSRKALSEPQCRRACRKTPAAALRRAALFANRACSRRACSRPAVRMLFPLRRFLRKLRRQMEETIEGMQFCNTVRQKIAS